MEQIAMDVLITLGTGGLIVLVLAAGFTGLIFHIITRDRYPHD